MWTVYMRDQPARSLQSDLDLQCPQQLLKCRQKQGKISKAKIIHFINYSAVCC